MRTILVTLFKRLLLFSARYLYNYIDKDNDGKISKDELRFLYKELKSLLNLVGKKK